MNKNYKKFWCYYINDYFIFDIIYNLKKWELNVNLFRIFKFQYYWYNNKVLKNLML